jgi:hypothetical protein
MTAASWALQKSMHAALSTNAGVLAALGGGRIYDDAPRGGPHPYVTFAETLTRDWTTGSEDGEEHLVTLHVWSQAAGRREALEIAGAIRSALQDQPLQLAGHRLINLQHESSEFRREGDGETYRGIIRFRAVTEPAS